MLFLDTSESRYRMLLMDLLLRFKILKNTSIIYVKIKINKKHSSWLNYLFHDYFKLNIGT